MKVYLIPMALLINLTLYAQDTTSKSLPKSEERNKVITENVFSPKIFLGQITNNPLVNNLSVDLAGEEFKLQGMLFQCINDRGIANINVAGKNENNSVGLFGGSNINAKVTADFSFTYSFNSFVRYNKKLTPEERNKVSYDMIVGDLELYDVNRILFEYVTFGFSGEGAKYYLIDSTALFSEMVTKQKYSGWQFYGQGNILSYRRTDSTNYTFLNSLKFTYGEVNNVADLDEYSISNSTSFSNGVNGQKFERKVTGYFDEYIKQHRLVMSYEFNYFNMDTNSTKVGLIAGADFILNSIEKDYFRFNAGFNFPVKFSAKKDEKAKRFYVGAILSTTDPFNMKQTSDFSFQNSLSASIRLSVPIKVNFRGE